PDASGNCTNPGSIISRNKFGSAQSWSGLTWSQTFFGCSTPGGTGCNGDGTTAAAFNGTNSPFKTNWNIVHIPYCTGDVHAGNAVQTYSPTGGGTLTQYFKGYNNITLDLAQMTGLFPTPSKIAIWGASAGGIGADCNLKKFRNAT